VTEPGWLTVTADDLAIWRQFPNAAFTLVRTANEAGEEYHLGTFELQEERQKRVTQRWRKHEEPFRGSKVEGDRIKLTKKRQR
jgi:hypothetical protein